MACHCFGIKLSEFIVDGGGGNVVKHAQTCMQMIAVATPPRTSDFPAPQGWETQFTC